MCDVQRRPEQARSGACQAAHPQVPQVSAVTVWRGPGHAPRTQPRPDARCCCTGRCRFLAAPLAPMSGLNSHRHRKDRVSGQLAPLPRTSSYGSHHSHASGSGHDRPRDGETAPAGPPPTEERVNGGGGGGGGGDGDGSDAHWNIGRSKHTVAFPSDAHRSVPAPSSPSHTTGGPAVSTHHIARSRRIAWLPRTHRMCRCVVCTQARCQAPCACGRCV